MGRQMSMRQSRTTCLGNPLRVRRTCGAVACAMSVAVGADLRAEGPAPSAASHRLVLPAHHGSEGAAGTSQDTCASLPPPTDTIEYRVYATLVAPARKDTLPTSYVQFVLDGLRHGFTVPTPLNVPAFGPFVGGRTGVMAPVVFGEVEFTLDATGKASDIHLTQSSLSPALDRSLYDAPRRADSLGLFPGQFDVSDRGKIRFFVALSSSPPATPDAMPYFAVRMPGWNPGSQAVTDPQHDWKPTFPIQAIQAAVGDSVAIQFAVDEHGVPIKTTMRVLGAGYLQYAELVVDAALRSRYVPATAGGCPVKGLMSRSWKLTVTRQYTR